MAKTTQKAKEPQKGQKANMEQNSGETQKRKMKPRGGNSPVIGDNGINLKDGDASKAAETIMFIIRNDTYFGDTFSMIRTEQDLCDLAATPFNAESIESMKRRFVGFVGYCMMKDVRFGNETAYTAIGVTKDDVYNWEHGRSKTPEHCEFIKKVKDFCRTYRELMGAAGLLNPVTLVWWQKNYDGLVDRQEVVLTPNNPLGAELTAQEISAKYAELPED